ncbi:hypothetical protein [Bradyrhizobium sp. USDA 329]|uniref:hypothetical protein n=1 Tax=unclassified Bradyrhizobium TaxID=2631580 RepID=UPI003518B1AA
MTDARPRTTALKWFRLYNDLINDPKVQSLPDRVFRGWINVLCIASKCAGILPPLQDVAFLLRLTPSRTQSLLDELKAAGLLDANDGKLSPHNWKGRQYESDSSTSRVRDYRDRRRNGAGNVSSTVPEAVPESETDPDSDSLVSNDTRPPREMRPSFKSTRKGKGPIPEGWRPNDQHAHLASSLGLDLKDVEQRFRDYCASKSVFYADHDAAFRNFLKNQPNFQRGSTYGKDNRRGGSIIDACDRFEALLDRQLAGQVEDALALPFLSDK